MSKLGMATRQSNPQTDPTRKGTPERSIVGDGLTSLARVLARQAAAEQMSAPVSTGATPSPVPINLEEHGDAQIDD